MGCASILHVINDLHPIYGGPSRSVTRLCEALAEREDVDISLLFQSRPDDPIVAYKRGRLKLHVVRSSPHKVTLGVAARAVLFNAAAKSDFVLFHSHGIWRPINHWAAQTARHFGIPHIVQPRGMLTSWAMNHRAWRKRLALSLYQRYDLETARALVATSESEYGDLRAFGSKQPIAVIPNIVQFKEADGEAACTRDVGDGTGKVLFLSRIHPIKGVLNLIEAWGRLRPCGWELIIAGPDDGGHLADVLKRMRSLGDDCVARYVGEVEGQDKARLYRQADIFVLPTFSENFGAVVGEALAYGLPVITTKGAPWRDLQTYGCGWWIDVGVEPLTDALRTAMAQTVGQRKAMGKNGIAYVRRYDSRRISSEMIGLYRWALAGCPLSDVPSYIGLD